MEDLEEHTSTATDFGATAFIRGRRHAGEHLTRGGIKRHAAQEEGNEAEGSIRVGRICFKEVLKWEIESAKRVLGDAKRASSSPSLPSSSFKPTNKADTRAEKQSREL